MTNETRSLTGESCQPPKEYFWKFKRLLLRSSTHESLLLSMNMFVNNWKAFPPHFTAKLFVIVSDILISNSFVCRKSFLNQTHLFSEQIHMDGRRGSLWSSCSRDRLRALCKDTLAGRKERPEVSSMLLDILSLSLYCKQLKKKLENFLRFFKLIDDMSVTSGPTTCDCHQFPSDSSDK